MARENRMLVQGTRVVVRLVPKAGTDAIEGWMKTADGMRVLKVRVAAAPERGKANAALIALLAKALDVPVSTIAIASGQTGRIKHVMLKGEVSRLGRRLETLGDIR